MSDDQIGKLGKEFKLKETFPVPTYEEWKAVVEKDLKGAPFEKKLVTKTYEGINLQPLYTKNDIENLPFTKEFPGLDNFLRGNNAAGYSEKNWEVAQEIPYGLAEEFNEALKHDLKRGLTAVNLQLDTATKLGLDADYADKGLVGDKGVSISGLKSIARALEGVDLAKTPLFINAGFSSLPILMLLEAYLKKQGIDGKAISGAIDADPLGYASAAGSLPVSLESALNEMKLALDITAKKEYNLRVIGVCSLPYHNAGANAVQELAYVMATAVEYIRYFLDKSIELQHILRSIRFTFGVGPNFFMEVAKFRAARLLWAKITEAFGAKQEDRKAVIHARTSRINQTKYDPYVNMLRTTTEAFSAVIGGVDSMHTNHFDELFGIPNEFSRRIARNVQIILSEESHLSQLIDPAGGSYYVEKLTQDVALEAWKQFQQIEDKGGMSKALESGFIKEKIDDVVALIRNDYSKRKSVLVGTNMYANATEQPHPERKPDHEAIYKKRAEYLQKFRVAGDQNKHTSIIDKLHKLTDMDSADALEHGIDALLEGATYGELCKYLRANNASVVDFPAPKPIRLAELFEELRDASAAYKKEHGKAPQLFLANMGPVKQYKARADFSRGFFEVAGFEVFYPSGFSTTEVAAEAALASDFKAVVICSTDDTYPELVPPITKAIKEKKPEVQVIVAGYPKDQIDMHKEAGVDDFIYLGCDAYQLLANLLKKIGVMA